MRKTASKISIVLVLVSVLCSCITIFPKYIPNTQNVPLFQEKGVLQTECSFTNFHSSYSLTNHIAVTANYFRKCRSDDPFWNGTSFTNYEATTQKLRFKEGEFSLGYFTDKGNFILELYAGCGFGNLNYNYQKSYYDYKSNFITDDWKFKSNTIKYYIQPDIAFRYEDAFVALSAKVLKYRYTKVRYNIDHEAIPDIATIFNPDFTRELYFIQPALTIRHQLLNCLQFQFQFGKNINLNRNISGMYFKEFIFDISIGLKISEFLKEQLRN